VFPSRLRNSIERLRQMVTENQPYRCHQCGWRKWRGVQVHADAADVYPDDLRTGRVLQPVSPQEFDQLDAPSTEPQ
jgi:hypothetical protein